MQRISNMIRIQITVTILKLLIAQRTAVAILTATSVFMVFPSFSKKLALELPLIVHCLVSSPSPPCDLLLVNIDAACMSSFNLAPLPSHELPISNPLPILTSPLFFCEENEQNF